MTKYLMIGCLSLMGFVAQLQAHRVFVENNVSVHVGGGGWGWHHGWYHDRVYYTDPWYHPSHVYFYEGDPYAVYYYGYPYYYFDPRFYYFH
jgi:hypothetical protein